MRKVFWRSWSSTESNFELERLKTLPLTNEWLDAHKNPNPGPNDIWLTTNGYDYKTGPFKKASWYAESFIYLMNEYNNFNRDIRYNHRYHFNPIYCKYPRTSYQQIMCWWRDEFKLYEETIKAKKPNFDFGMVLSYKPTLKRHKADNGYMRSIVVEAAKQRSFKYYGTNWQKADKNYGGEVYVKGHRGTPQKFNDARILMTKAKFVICLENCYDQIYSQNYLTEKIFHGFLSCSVPIYYGCYNVEKLLDPSLFIDFRKFKDWPSLLNHCEKMPETEYQGYLSRIGEFLQKDGQKFTCENRFLELDQQLNKL